MDAVSQEVDKHYYRHAQKQHSRLACQQSRKKPVNRNREKARLRLARLDERIADRRRDFHHKVNRQLVEENQFIGLEDLNIQGMMACEARFAHHHLVKSIGDIG